MNKFALVAVDIPSLSKLLLFSTNGFAVQVGDIIAINVRNNLKAGIVAELVNENQSITEKDINPILSVVSSGHLSRQQINLAKTISEYYCCPLLEAIKLMLPAGYTLKIIEEKNEDGSVVYNLAKKPVSDKKVKILTLNSIPEKATEKQKKVIELLKENRSLTKNEAAKLAGVTTSVIDRLAVKGIVGFTEKTIDRLPAESYTENYERPELNTGQKKAFLRVLKSIESGKKNIFVLFGVTASGKTEVYLQLIEECLKRSKTAIYLLPEISLTPQVISRLKSRFGDKVAVLHSNMSAGERFDQFRGIREGKYKIAVGPRSALFAPLENIGLIVLDEEQEATYKQNRTPRYDARNVALMKAEIEKSVVIFGSATPSIETLHKAEIGEFELLNIHERAVGGKAKISVVDLRAEPNKDNCLSRYLNKKIKDLAENEKSVIYLNRRGFSGFLICRNCGYIPKCPNCDVSLTLHGRYLICHYCNKIIQFSDQCPECRSKLNKYLAAGTQRVEWEIGRNHPDVKVIRMDADTTSKKGSHGLKLKDFRDNKSVLIGTQMIAKGLDYPDVSVVGAINTEVGLNMPDFRSNERVFQLLYQLCGRAGRGEIASEVVLQTYDPENQTIKDIIKGDYKAFYEHEIKRRKELDYPPFSKLINIGIKGKDKEKVKDVAKKIVKKIKELEVKGIKEILGPSAAPLSYIKKNYRWHILIKAENNFGGQMKICSAANSISRKGVSIIVDVDPVSML